MTCEESKLTVVLGGARTGKSGFALRLAKERASRVCFIATAQALDDDMTKRIARHRDERPAHWTTIEEPYQLHEALLQASDSQLVIVDCLTLFVSNWLLRSEDEADCEETIRKISESFLTTLVSLQLTVICVSNEVGLGIVPETRLGRTFRDLLGRVNQQFAEAADEVYLLVAGLPLRLKPAG
ncbi:MAG TPA: bifunctional adenosylcobinamide kinase/adenosylcobinamide-phosphate guanylyltransferase [Pyrinomonadaceae bacterium]|nr:bifunctional adenosylcobinamide kinase/adenosylcobinamide-phosphate guanylyltransferase [Pyrinomonadaceae bacterium]